MNELSPTEEGKPVKSKRKKKLPGENRRKRKKNEEEEEEDFEISDEGEWEVYKPELWESSDFVVAEVIHQASSTVATTIPTSAIVESSHTSSVTENTTVEKITSESTLEVNHKPQRKTRIARESKRELKADTSRIDVLCAPPSTSALRHQLPGIVSCPNKRYKGVVEIK